MKLQKSKLNAIDEVIILDEPKSTIAFPEFTNIAPKKNVNIYDEFFKSNSTREIFESGCDTSTMFVLP